MSATGRIPAVRVSMSAVPRGFGGFTRRSRHGGQVVWKAVPDPKRALAWWDTDPTTDDVHYGAKGVYPWLVSRRYAVAEGLTCKQNSDCGAGFFCGRNQCEALKPIAALCDPEPAGASAGT